MRHAVSEAVLNGSPIAAPRFAHVRRPKLGRALKAEIASTLDAVEQRYGVPQGIILGIWGLESNYGGAALNWDAQAALATLAYEGRRRQQFETYLMALAEMVERGLADQQQLRS